MRKYMLFFFVCCSINFVSAQVETTPSITLNIPNGGEFWQYGKTTKISWNSSKLTSNINIEYSIDNGLNWNVITNVPSTTTDYDWMVPNSVSETSLIRVTSDFVSDSSDEVFEISDDDTICNIVILGSSTSAGLGASVLEKAWVSLYSEAIFLKNTKFNIINLSKGGYTTYHVLPTGSFLPINVDVSVDTHRNITKALDYNPVAIIVNLPSNDTSKGYSVEDQMSNYNIIYNKALDSNIPLWIATPQPRNFRNPLNIQKQRDVRDAILMTYNTKAINFWTNIAESNGKILINLDSGDGTHLNDKGHTLLYKKVLAKNIPVFNSEFNGANFFICN